jgi:hypothetical protein
MFNNKQVRINKFCGKFSNSSENSGPAFRAFLSFFHHESKRAGDEHWIMIQMRWPQADGFLFSVINATQG